MHEDYSRKTEITLGSERVFGLVIGSALLIIAIWPLISGNSPRWWLVLVGAVFWGLAWLAPKWLAPLNWLWFRFGLLLHAIINPLVMGIMFFLVITPIGLIMRLRGKDLLHLRRAADSNSYWIKREPPGPTPDSLKNQF